ncbi:fimbrial protein [Klebsiella aerogenes]|uniref:fimbrial protein n=1 Tax=Klebsiella aerogenes TaxID=548 RepID=UPI0018670B98|nr:fimbrial protein [Klebsiella aerogenes]
MNTTLMKPTFSMSTKSANSGQPWRITWTSLPIILLMLAMTCTLTVSIRSVQAAQVGDSRSITFHGTLRKKPCHIANDGDIYIHFGNVGIRKLDGQRYLQDIPYTLKCDELDPSWMLKMTLKGTQSGFENTALKTNVSGLGIRILEEGQPLEINKAFDISYDRPPKLQAVPVQQNNVKLVEQGFSATATLLAEYE